MNFETIIEAIYHITGILVASFFLLVVIILKKEKQEVVKSRIFLRYNLFRTAFYIAFIGGAFFLIGNILGWYNHETFGELFEITEVVYNLCLSTFIIILYVIIRGKNLKGM